jgi:GNAT superfamily N-acetyltransferase
MPQSYVLSIRQAEIGDAPALAAIKRAIEDRTYSGFGSASEHRESLERFCSADYVAGLINGPATTVLVPERRGIPVGLGAITEGRECMRLHALYSVEQGRGVGLLLVQVAANLTVTRGRETICCEIFEANVRAVSFFTKLGFVPFGARPSESYSQQRLIQFRANATVVRRETGQRLGEHPLSPQVSTTLV